MLYPGVPCRANLAWIDSGWGSRGMSSMITQHPSRDFFKIRQTVSVVVYISCTRSCYIGYIYIIYIHKVLATKREDLRVLYDF